MKYDELKKKSDKEIEGILSPYNCGQGGPDFLFNYLETRKDNRHNNAMYWLNIFVIFIMLLSLCFTYYQFSLTMQESIKTTDKLSKLIYTVEYSRISAVNRKSIDNANEALVEIESDRETLIRLKDFCSDLSEDSIFYPNISTSKTSQFLANEYDFFSSKEDYQYFSNSLAYLTDLQARLDVAAKIGLKSNDRLNMYNAIKKDIEKANPIELLDMLQESIEKYKKSIQNTEGKI